MKLDAARAKLVRRHILASLQSVQGDQYDGWLGQRTLFAVLAPSMRGLALADVRQALSYLASAGLVETRDQRTTKFVPGDLDARITARGVNLLEETVPPDPGVEDDRD
jgi:hypothetical protein